MTFMKRLLLLIVPMLLAGVQVMQAQRTLTGVVISAEDNLGLPGVAVTVQGTTIGAITDIDGRFSLKAPENATILVFNFVGMATQEIPINGKATFNVTMSPTATTLSTTVVTAMGIERSEKTLGYAVAAVSSDQLVQKSEPDALRALEGKIPGVNISASSGQVGSSTRINVRGNNSFYGNNEPLFVVDGVPYSNSGGGGGNQFVGSAGATADPFSTLDPNDIAELSVLKGAAAAALYGSRAANGVVLITTKSGSKSRRMSQKGTEISVMSSVAWEKIGNLPEYQNTYGAGSGFTYQNANGSWGPAFGTIDSIPTWPDYKAAFPEMGEYQAYRNYADNVESLFQTGMTFDNSIGVSSNNDKGSLSITVSDLRQTGYIPNSEFNRTSFSFGGNTRLDNKFKVGGNFSYSKSQQLGSMYGNDGVAGQTSAFARTMFLARNWNMDLPYEDSEGNPVSTNKSQYDNPKWAFEHNTVTTNMHRAVANANIGYTVADWLTINYLIGFNRYSEDRTSVIDVGSRGASGLGSIGSDVVGLTEIESNLSATVSTMLAKGFSLQATLGQNANQRSSEYTTAGGEEMVARGVYTVGNTKGQTAGSGTSMRRLVGLYADMAFGYNNYLFLNLTGRMDMSSTLPKENNTYFYPGAAVSFVFSDFFKISNDVFNLGRVRLGYAKVGNDASPYYTNGKYGIGSTYRGQPTMSLVSTVYDENLKPEFTKEFEAGAELTFFKNRLHADFTYYDRRTTDQIAPLAQAASSGKANYITNLGEIRNNGVEIALDATPVRLQNSFEWNIAVTFTKNINEVRALGAEMTDDAMMTLNTGCSNCPIPTLQVGHEYGYLRGTKAPKDSATGQHYLINSETGLLLRSDSLYDLGNVSPDYTMGFINTFKFKNFTLGVVFDISKGGIIYTTSVQNMLGRGVTKDTEDRLGLRVIPGVLADATTGKAILDENGNYIQNYIPITAQQLYFTDGFATNSAHEFSVFDATVFRLREISLGYDFPKAWLSKTPFGSANLSFSARNLWYFAPNVPEYTNYDPVANSGGSGNIQGLDYNVAPSSKRYGVNLRFTF